MEFEYTAIVWIEPSSIEEMLELCRQSYTCEQAIAEVSAGWEDVDYYAVDNVSSQLAKELERRLEVERG